MPSQDSLERSVGCSDQPANLAPKSPRPITAKDLRSGQRVLFLDWNLVLRITEVRERTIRFQAVHAPITPMMERHLRRGVPFADVISDFIDRHTKHHVFIEGIDPDFEEQVQALLERLGIAGGKALQSGERPHASEA